MKKISLILAFLLLFSIPSFSAGSSGKSSNKKSSTSSSTSSGSGKVGVGFIVGSFSGLNLRILGSGNSAVNLDLAWDSHDHTLVVADYIINNRKPISNMNGFPVYYGIGLKASDCGDDTLGFRFVLGSNFRLTDIDKNMEFFLELAPGLTVIDHTEADFDLGLGLRYYF
jgi:V8-like Glu-specific endopeptidase